jgi:hypothetical protein
MSEYKNGYEQVPVGSIVTISLYGDDQWLVVPPDDEVYQQTFTGKYLDKGYVAVHRLTGEGRDVDGFPAWTCRVVRGPSICGSCEEAPPCSQDDYLCADCRACFV